MYTLSRIAMKTNFRIEQIRMNAIAEVFEDFKKACRHYYETCEGGEEVTKLYHRLEELGANMEAVIDTDLEIRDEVFA